MNILVVDDESQIVDFLAEIISSKGHKVDMAFDGDRAFELLKVKTYDLVFLDYNMPGQTGLRLVEHIRKVNMNTKTVIMTGSPMVTKFYSKALGADEHFAKPFDISEIEKIIDKYAEKR